MNEPFSHCLESCQRRMNMDNSLVSIVNLPIEMLLNIFDVLYSLVGTNEKLDNIACDRTFTRSIDLTFISSSEKDDSKTNALLHRFCLHILPPIHNNVECLTVEAYFLERILHGNKFFNLHRMILINLDVNMALSNIACLPKFHIHFHHFVVCASRIKTSKNKNLKKYSQLLNFLISSNLTVVMSYYLCRTISFLFEYMSTLSYHASCWIRKFSNSHREFYKKCNTYQLRKIEVNQIY